MRKTGFVLLAVTACILNIIGEGWCSQIDWQDLGDGNLNVSAVLPKNNNADIYIGTNRGIFVSRDSGQNWRNIFVPKGGNRNVNFLAFAGIHNQKTIYACTGNGLFYTPDHGANWKVIFKGRDEFERDVTSIIVLDRQIYLGTKAGLFISRDHGRSWSKASGVLGNSHVLTVIFSPVDPLNVYAACTEGVFISTDGARSWMRVFTACSTENGNAGDEYTGDDDRQSKVPGIRYLALDPGKEGTLYLATDKGVYKSQNKGELWETVSSYGLLSEDVRFLLCSKEGQLYCTTGSGVFEYKNGRWQELSFTLPLVEVRQIALDLQGNLYAAGDKGLFKAYRNEDSGNPGFSKVEGCVPHEPSINELQQVAIHYAQVEPEKIKQWEKLAAKKAFFPKVTTSVGRDTADLWHWETGSSTKTGDDLLVPGRDTIDWDVSLTWDLGEIIWNPDQTSIDTRSRLLVQLRGDILDEVTKLYFERLRVKNELDNLRIEDVRKRQDKELKLRELAASLDALTGGYFSSHLTQ